VLSSTQFVLLKRHCLTWSGSSRDTLPCALRTNHVHFQSSRTKIQLQPMPPNRLEEFELDAKNHHRGPRFSCHKCKIILLFKQTPILSLLAKPICLDQSPDDRALPHPIICLPGRSRASPRHHRGWESDPRWDGCGSRPMPKHFCEWPL